MGGRVALFFNQERLDLPLPGDLLDVLSMLHCLNDTITLWRISYYLWVLLLIPYRQEN